MAEELKDPGGHPSNSVQVGEGMGDEYEEAKASSGSGDQESVKDIKARLGEASDEELVELAKDDRKGVQDAVAAEQKKREEAAAEADGSDAGDSGSDDSN